MWIVVYVFLRFSGTFGAIEGKGLGVIWGHNNFVVWERGQVASSPGHWSWYDGVDNNCMSGQFNHTLIRINHTLR